MDIHFKKHAMFAGLLLYVLGFFAPIQAFADSQYLSANSMTLRDAIKTTLAHNPQLNSFQFRQQALAGEQQSARLKPALHLSGDVENIAGSGDYKSADNGELTLALSSVLELGDKREARMGVVTERQHALITQQRIAELDVLAEVTRRFVEVAAAQQYVALHKSSLALASETTAAIKRRVDIGNTPDVELARAQAHQARMTVALQYATLNFDTAKINLSSLWGVTEPSFTTVTADLLRLDDATPLNKLLENLASNPDLLMYANEARLRDAELRLANSLRKTDIEWSAGVRRLQASKDSALVLGVSVPLSGASRANGEIATAHANRLNVDNERDAAVITLRTQIFGLYQARQAAVFEVKSLANDIIPQLKKAVSGSQTAFDKGRYSYFELTSAQRELLEAEAALIDAATRAHTLTTDLERLTGNALHADLNAPSNKTLPNKTHSNFEAK